MRRRGHLPRLHNHGQSRQTVLEVSSVHSCVYINGCLSSSRVSFFALFFVLVLTLYCHYSSGYNDLSKCRCSKDRDSSDNCRFFSWEHEMTCNRCRSKGHSVYCCIKWVDSWSKYRLVFEALLKTLLSLRRRSQGHPFAQLRMTALSHMQHKCHALSQYAYQYCW